MSTEAFAQEMSKIANAKLRAVEIIGGAALGGLLGAGVSRGARDDEMAGLLAGAAAGAGAAFVAGRMGISHSAIKKLKAFQASKKFQSSAELLAEGSDFLSRPAQIKKQLAGLNPAEAGNLPAAMQRILDNVPGALKKEQRKLDVLRNELAALQSQRATAVQMKAYDETARFDGEIADLRRWAGGLNYVEGRVRGMKSMLSKARNQVSGIKDRRNLLLGEQKRLRAEAELAEKAIKDTREAHKKMLEAVRKGAFQDASSRTFGVF